MKKNKLICLIMMFVVIACSFISSCYCSELTIGDFHATEESYYFSKDENEIYMPFMRFSEKSIIVDKELNNMGAIFSGSNIEVNSAINKPIAIFANDSVRINENIKSAVVFSSTNIIIDANVEGDLILFGANAVTITEKASVKGDIICFAADTNINGKIEGNLIGSASNLNVTSNISKDLRMEVSNVDIKDETLIGGKIYLESQGVNQSVEKLKQAYPDLINKVIEEEKVDIKDTIYNVVLSILITWVVYLIVNKISKKDIFKTSLQKIEKYKTQIILVSAISLVSMPIVLIVAFILIAFGITVVGVPVLVIYFALLLLALSTSLFVIGSIVNAFILTKYDFKGNKVAKVFASLGVFAVLKLLTVLPVVSGIVSVLYVMFTMGIILICACTKNVNN